MTNKQSATITGAGQLVLRPRTSTLIDNFLADEALLRSILTVCGSPVNVLFPQSIAANARAFEDVLATHHLNGALHFAHKATQSNTPLRQMAITNLRADVASARELEHALSCGFTGTRLGATGPKNAEFLYLCLLHGITINVDSLQELNDLINIKHSLGFTTRARVLLRLCGFGAEDMVKESRFGIHVSDTSYALRTITEHDTDVELLGFSFHLDSTSLDERLVAIENCLTVFEQAIDQGFEPHVLNIGGGFRINYLADENDWNRFTTAIKQAALGTGPEITWQRNYFGLSAQAGTLRGNLNSYSYYEPNPSANFLNDLLNSELSGYGNQKVAAVLRNNMIELWLEPGRALLDLVGLTLSRVNGVKTSSASNTLVALNMKRQDVAFLDQEVFVDPLLVTNSGAQGNPESVYLTGNLCLESDLIFRRQVILPRVPQAGDILCFVNTAAYMMDFSATTSIMQPRARSVAVIQNNNRFTWMLDEQYTPVWHFYNRRSEC